MNPQEKIIDDFKGNSDIYERFTVKLDTLIRELLDIKNIKVHQITCRTKDLKTLEGKLSRKKDKYSNLSEITDLSGIRIITYFEDEVDTIANLIEQEFEIDIQNSIDKRILETDRFGYKSLHYVISLNKSRNKISEYKIFKGLKAEIQVRSILQHAWAEIEHDIGYKSSIGIPDIAKRDFSRVAALLETADLEFTRLRTKLTEYKKDVELEITNNPLNVDLNNISLHSFAQNDSLINEIDQSIAKRTGLSLIITGFTDNVHYIATLQYLGINNIEQLSKLLKENRKEIEDFATVFLLLDNEEGSNIHSGISLFYLCYLILAQKGKKERTEFVDKFFGLDTYPELPDEILQTYNKIKNLS